jgi:hypothetical protein
MKKMPYDVKEKLLDIMKRGATGKYASPKEYRYCEKMMLKYPDDYTELSKKVQKYKMDYTLGQA